MAVKLVTAPAVEPMNLDEAKTYLRVEHNDEDEFIAGLVVAARSAAEDFTGRALITQTWKLLLDTFPRKKRVGDQWWDGAKEGPLTMIDGELDFIEIPKPPLQSLTHIKAYHEDGSITTMAGADYIVDTASEPGRAVLKAGKTWPVNLQRANGVEAQFVCGYGASGFNVPEGIKLGMRLAMEKWHEERDHIGVAPASAIAAWQPYRALRGV